MTQYEAIFQRCSTRRFQMSAIDAAVMEQLNHYIQTVNALHPEASYRIAVVEVLNGERPAIKGRFMTEAPYYLVFWAKEHPFAAKNAGYIMEQIVLYLTTKGLGTCYLGDTKAEESVDHYKCMIVVAFGKPVAAMYGSKTKRKPLSELVSYKEEPTAIAQRILEAGRMAPSAMNKQPWRFVVGARRIHIFMKKSSVMFLSRWQELEEIDMGILMTHMAYAAEEQWLNWKLQALEDAAVQKLKGYCYVASLSFFEQGFPEK